VTDEPRHEETPTHLPPLIDWCSRHGEVVFFAALLLPVLLEGCAIHAARTRDSGQGGPATASRRAAVRLAGSDDTRSDRRREPSVQYVRIEVSSVGPVERPAQRVDLHLCEVGRIPQWREDWALQILSKVEHTRETIVERHRNAMTVEHLDGGESGAGGRGDEHRLRKLRQRGDGV
jgi:hypothetical protein